MALQRTTAGRQVSSAATATVDVAVLRCEGEMGQMELAHLGEELFRLAHRGINRVVIDLAGVDHVDYRGLKPVASRARLLRTAGGGIKLAGPTPYVAAIFRAAGVEDEFEMYRTAEEAKLAFASQPALAVVRG
ncbi:MAG TPA: STAS domain-containing protein [Myxococcales bacterium]|jgi:anti-anti-sigma factor